MEKHQRHGFVRLVDVEDLLNNEHVPMIARRTNPAYNHRRQMVGQLEEIARIAFSN